MSLLTEGHKQQSRVLTIDFTRRLPDINRESQLPSWLDRYGRFAILRSGAFWFGGIGTSHPASTQEGFYWALSDDCLYLSPRGSTYRWTEHITQERIRLLLDRLSIRRRSAVAILPTGSVFPRGSS